MSIPLNLPEPDCEKTRTGSCEGRTSCQIPEHPYVEQTSYLNKK